MKGNMFAECIGRVAAFACYSLAVLTACADQPFSSTLAGFYVIWCGRDSKQVALT
jgi:hypothetical protein